MLIHIVANTIITKRLDEGNIRSFLIIIIFFGNYNETREIKIIHARPYTYKSWKVRLQREYT